MHRLQLRRIIRLSRKNRRVVFFPLMISSMLMIMRKGLIYNSLDDVQSYILLQFLYLWPIKGISPSSLKGFGRAGVRELLEEKGQIVLGVFCNRLNGPQSLIQLRACAHVNVLFNLSRSASFHMIFSIITFFCASIHALEVSFQAPKECTSWCFHAFPLCCVYLYYHASHAYMIFMMIFLRDQKNFHFLFLLKVFSHHILPYFFLELQKLQVKTLFKPHYFQFELQPFLKFQQQAKVFLPLLAQCYCFDLNQQVLLRSRWMVGLQEISLEHSPQPFYLQPFLFKASSLILAVCLWDIRILL